MSKHIIESERRHGLIVFVGAVLVVIGLGINVAYSAEQCADGTECPTEPTDQELEDSCSDEGVSL